VWYKAAAIYNIIANLHYTKSVLEKNKLRKRNEEMKIDVITLLISYNFLSSVWVGKNFSSHWNTFAEGRAYY
jgi:hypothetical protein